MFKEIPGGFALALPERYPRVAPVPPGATRRTTHARLTDAFIRGLKPATRAQGRYEVFDSGTKHQKYPGLAVRISHSGRKSFAVLYRRNGRLKRFTIGAFPLVSLRDARTKVLEILHDKNADPAGRRRIRREALTFGELSEEFRRQYVESDQIRPATAENYRRYLKTLDQHFGEFKVCDIGRDDVEDFRDRRARTPVGTNRQIEVLSRIFTWAREHRELRAFVTENPCAGLKALRERPVAKYL